MIPVFVISLTRSQDRRAMVMKQMEHLGIGFEFFNAVDGRALTVVDLGKVDFSLAREYCGHDLSRAEVGCALSHIRLYELIVAQGIERCVILEDDVYLHMHFKAIIETIVTCNQADIVVTATPSREPLFSADWIRAGTHVASMGSDAAGKQELPPELFEQAALFCDHPAQAVVMGDLQHFGGDYARITALGDVLRGKSAGRTSTDQITIFDSSGIALQDLTIARSLIAAKQAQIGS